LHREEAARQNVDFFARQVKRCTGLSPLLALQSMDPDRRPPKLVERLHAEVERAEGGRLTDKELAAMSIDPSTARRSVQASLWNDIQAYTARVEWVLPCAKTQGRTRRPGRNGSGFESESGFVTPLREFLASRRPQPKHRRFVCPAHRNPLGAMLAIADDQGLRLLEFVDRRAMERELSILRKSLRTNVVPANIDTSLRFDRNWPTIFRERISNSMFRSRRLDHRFNFALGLLRSIPVGETRSYPDGEATRRRRDAPGGWSRQTART